MRNNPGLSSLIIGIIMNIVNMVMTCVMLFSGYMLFGGLFIIIPIAGIASSVKGIKLGQGPIAIIALILNIIATLGSLLLTAIGIFFKVMS